jgi:hypothetical protein
MKRFAFKGCAFSIEGLYWNCTWKFFMALYIQTMFAEEFLN